MPQWLIDFMQQYSSGKFFGAVVLQYQGGQVVNIRVERNFKPQDLESG